MISPVAGALLIALIPLYTRIAADDALRHRTRAALHALLAGRPGLDRQQIAGALGVNVATIVHHLEVLHALGLVRSRRVGRTVLYDVGARAGGEHPALRDPSRREIARLMGERPRTQGEIAGALGISQRLVAYHLQQMAPLVQADAERPRRYSLVPG